ncbi:MAG: hypothetical protein NT179_06845 [Nitrospirae bacterium]|nr:hypothetical protein [Nitrospirota bacterium]
MSVRPASNITTSPANHPRLIQRIAARPLTAGLIVTLLLLALFPCDSSSKENRIFERFTRHIGQQIHKDKQAFAQASSCMAWFYHKAKTPPPPTAQGISWQAASQTEVDCPRAYPGGMDEARDDFSKTQSLLSVSLTFYEFALVADRNDDAIYSHTELQDLFRTLALPYDERDLAQTQVASLMERFNSWYRSRNMDALMQGMSDLYERGYRVTPSDRAELNRVMG